ncbi:conserved hypothetical phage protein [Citrobacter phage CR8]|uniref:Conserved hypothetical phage protein n=1 Tax=Citrobacter phage CR8 TaxID=1455076 RepID=W6PPQ2_9CAUD|nr:hypothetical protein CF79_gp56 [Citrobacter phage CR8]CDM21640.1 conserved hypothetical phage protein [Citrobacter phage CR8]
MGTPQPSGLHVIPVIRRTGTPMVIDWLLCWWKNSMKTLKATIGLPQTRFDLMTRT